ncbi:hypothetical protein PCANC_13154 [Puccinia coronata f. sp. avenae]|uniref:Uncharacterized protein n=1 Tax=Puccinia coronata f. sp. avenae TaxID=200324 RepID=A0A2N5UCG1_9BASI|nr:hypothetical protein PCASD_14000 [Puccinia coronata f. sp. avenae]PLW42021.1 hypothetical protein PCANC_13154 [Puccinia coronata f. sp. avenae]
MDNPVTQPPPVHRSQAGILSEPPTNNKQSSNDFVPDPIDELSGDDLVVEPLPVRHCQTTSHVKFVTEPPFARGRGQTASTLGPLKRLAPEPSPHPRVQSPAPMLPDLPLHANLLLKPLPFESALDHKSLLLSHWTAIAQQFLHTSPMNHRCVMLRLPDLINQAHEPPFQSIILTTVFLPVINMALNIGQLPFNLLSPQFHHHHQDVS